MAEESVKEVEKICPGEVLDLRDMDDSQVQESSDEETGSCEDDLITLGTVVKEADVMVHPRGSCPINAFRKTFKEKKVFSKNEKFCEKCFCYVCDIVASECQYWTSEKVRHCNAYHTKDGLWRYIREKHKDRKAKEQNLLQIKRDLHEKRKRKRQEEASKPSPIIDLSDLEEKMRRIEEVKKRKEDERLIKKGEDRQKKIENQEAFTYQTHEAFDSYESTAPPAFQPTLEETETLPDFSKASQEKPKIQVKINFQAKKVTPSEDSDVEPNLLLDPSRPKKKRLLEDPMPQDFSATDLEISKQNSSADENSISNQLAEYSDLPMTLALPDDQLKPAGSGISNNGLSHLQQWLASTKHNANLNLKKAQETFKPVEGKPKMSFSKLKGIRLERVYDDKDEAKDDPKKGQFHTAIPFNYNQRGGGPPKSNFTQRGGRGHFDRGGRGFQPTRGGADRGRGNFDGGGHPNRGGGQFDRGRGHSDRGRGYSDRGRGHSDRGRGHSDRGRGHSDRGRGHSDRGRGHSDRGRGHSDRGRGHSGRGGGYSDRGRGYSERGRGQFPRGGSDTGQTDRVRGHFDRGGRGFHPSIRGGIPNRGRGQFDSHSRGGSGDHRNRDGRSSYPSRGDTHNGRGSYQSRGNPDRSRTDNGRESYPPRRNSNGPQQSSGSQSDPSTQRDQNVPRPNPTRNIPRFSEGKLNRPMGRDSKSRAYDELLQDVDKHRNDVRKKEWENSKLDRDIQKELRRTQRGLSPIVLGEVRVAEPTTFGSFRR